jgi:hypothetical protein
VVCPVVLNTDTAIHTLPLNIMSITLKSAQHIIILALNCIGLELGRKAHSYTRGDTRDLLRVLRFSKFSKQDEQSDEYE